MCQRSWTVGNSTADGTILTNAAKGTGWESSKVPRAPKAKSCTKVVHPKKRRVPSAGRYCLITFWAAGGTWVYLQGQTVAGLLILGEDYKDFRLRPQGIIEIVCGEGSIQFVTFFFCRCRARSKLWSSIQWLRLSIPTHENKVKQNLRCLPSNHQAATNTNKQQTTKTKQPNQKNKQETGHLVRREKHYAFRKVPMPLSIAPRWNINPIYPKVIIHCMWQWYKSYWAIPGVGSSCQNCSTVIATATTRRPIDLSPCFIQFVTTLPKNANKEIVLELLCVVLPPNLQFLIRTYVAQWSRALQLTCWDG